MSLFIRTRVTGSAAFAGIALAAAALALVSRSAPASPAAEIAPKPAATGIQTSAVERVAAPKVKIPKSLLGDVADLDRIRFNWIEMDADGNWVDFELAPDAQRSDGKTAACTVKITDPKSAVATYSCTNVNCEGDCTMVVTPLGGSILMSCACGTAARFVP